MKFDSLIPATLERRYKRFLADVVLSSGERITVHCPNTGKMTGCDLAGSKVWLADSANPKRKYRYTWELIETRANNFACIHSARANALVEEALLADVITPLIGFAELQREVPFPDHQGLADDAGQVTEKEVTQKEVTQKEVTDKKAANKTRSRADFYLRYPGGDTYPDDDTPLGAAQDCFIEVKSVTLHLGQGRGAFPDAVSDRARRHIAALMSLVKQGRRAVLLFCVQHSEIEEVSPADHIDPKYGALLRAAVAEGVEVLAYKADISAESIVLRHPLPVVI
jgi:sugar fermentation stimulation protein A